MIPIGTHKISWKMLLSTFVSNIQYRKPRFFKSKRLTFKLVSDVLIYHPQNFSDDTESDKTCIITYTLSDIYDVIIILFKNLEFIFDKRAVKKHDYLKNSVKKFLDADNKSDPSKFVKLFNVCKEMIHDIDNDPIHFYHEIESWQMAVIDDLLISHFGSNTVPCPVVLCKNTVPYIDPEFFTIEISSIGSFYCEIFGTDKKNSIRKLSFELSEIKKKYEKLQNELLMIKAKWKNTIEHSVKIEKEKQELEKKHTEYMDILAPVILENQRLKRYINQIQPFQDAIVDALGVLALKTVK